jgi:hypothetical protein
MVGTSPRINLLHCFTKRILLYKDFILITAYKSMLIVGERISVGIRTECL